MNGDPTSRIRAPLISPVARASFVPTILATGVLIGSIEAEGAWSYALLAIALLLVAFAIRRAWRVAQRETERLT